MSITYNKNEHHIRLSFEFRKLILLTLKFVSIAFSSRYRSELMLRVLKKRSSPVIIASKTVSDMGRRSVLEKCRLFCHFCNNLSKREPKYFSGVKRRKFCIHWINSEFRSCELVKLICSRTITLWIVSSQLITCV